MIAGNDDRGDKPDELRRESTMQAAVTRDHSTAETPTMYRALFDRFWEDVAPLNNYSPEAARALLARESSVHEQMPDNGFDSDPWTAVRAALQERAAGRPITRMA